jgi:dTDP-4-amino-4,6-dideoxygalactose transaminase
MAALLLDIEPGDEVIMPSFTFVSTANAVALRGAVPVFIDIRPDTLNIDERLIEAAITPRTKAIFVVHYAGVACEMDTIMEIAGRHGLLVVEDAAQGLRAFYRGRPLGSIGHFAAISFHETKNFISGEGGALLVNDASYIERAEILREKGTNRTSFARGEVSKYTWLDIGSSYLPSDMIAAFLWAQFEQADQLQTTRCALWQRYHDGFAPLEEEGLARRPIIPGECEHNAHLYYLLLPDSSARDTLIAQLRERGVQAPFHYVPLHSAPAGRKLARTHGSLTVTENASSRLLRMPLWHTMRDEPERVVETVGSLLTSVPAKRASAVR